jgi:acetyltransferase-like isoleucine patch superfamily enzyme
MGDHVRIVSVNFVNHDGGVWVLRTEYPDLDLIDRINIGNNVFIGQGATLLPGTKIGDNVVVGARSLVKGNLPGGFVYAGIPAREICTIEEYKEKTLKHGVATKNMSLSGKEMFLKEKFL